MTTMLNDRRESARCDTTRAPRSSRNEDASAEPSEQPRSPGRAGRAGQGLSVADQRVLGLEKWSSPPKTPRGTSGPLDGLPFARLYKFPFPTLQAQKWHIHGSGTFGGVWWRGRRAEPLEPGQVSEDALDLGSIFADTMRKRRQRQEEDFAVLYISH